MDHVTVSVYNYADQKVCDLYDNQISARGQAFDMSITYNINGSKSFTFSLPFMIEESSNWRWRFIKPEYKIRVRIGNEEDWFVIDKPKFSKSTKSISGTVTCAHASEILKTKNLYLYFDDENGIGELPYLMDQILAGTGWVFDEEASDVFYENYAIENGSVTSDIPEEDRVIKKRSIKSDTKTGAYALIGKVCDLFNGYPEYIIRHNADGELERKVIIRDLNHKKPMWEMTMGKNLSSISVDYDSSSIVTRLYVEGEYTDAGEYVGIDDVNPTGLTYLFNFDYYKTIGAFTEEHQAALDYYLAHVLDVKQRTMTTATELEEKASKLNNLWGQCKYVIWTVENSQLKRQIIGGTFEESKKNFDVGDTMYIFTDNGEYTTIQVTIDVLNEPTRYYLKPNVTHIMKFVTKASGSIGAKEVAIEAKQQVIDELIADNAKEITSEEQKSRNNSLIASNRLTIEGVLRGSSDVSMEEAFQYTVKVAGTETMKAGKTLELQMIRTSPAAVSSTSHFLSTTNKPIITSDETVTTYTAAGSSTRLVFGDYGTSGILPVGLNQTKIPDTPITNPDVTILDVSTVGKKINFSVSTSSTADVMKLEGTTFTITVKALAYGLYEQFRKALLLADQVDILRSTQTSQLDEQKVLERDFTIAMGDLLKDGYWNDENYIVGQEQFLFNDAMDIMKEISKPGVKYSVSLMRLSEEMGMTPDDMEINSKIRLYDPELEINDTVYVSKIQKYLDDLSKSSVEISNEEVEISGASFDSIFSRITSISDMIQEKQEIFKRAESLREDGSLPTQRLEGAIDLLTTQLSSAVSSWYTDQNGNIIFESVNGDAAMMLCGEGFMIAAGKRDDGTWNWRTFGTGKGFTADAIITGYLSADRIEANSITANKLASDVGKSLDLSSNTSINLHVSNMINNTSYRFSVTSDNGFFLTKEIDKTTLSPVIMNGDADITNSQDNAGNLLYPDSLFNWTRKSGDADGDSVWNESHKGMKRVEISAVDIASGSTFECRATIDGKLYFASAAVSNLKETTLQLYLSSVQPSTQIYDPNVGGGYSPNWAVTPLIVIPYLFQNDIKVTPNTTSTVSVVWKRRVGTVESDLISGETVGADGKLTVNQNVLANAGANTIAYVCYAYYAGEFQMSQSVTYTLLTVAALPRSIEISGGHVFRYDNGVLNPNTITLTATTSNVSIRCWEYRNANNAWTKVPGSDSQATITITPTQTGWNDDEFHVRVLTNYAEVYDLYTLYKITNDPQPSGVPPYAAFLAYSAYSDGHVYSTTPNINTRYIGMYAGHQTDPAQLTYEDYTWTLYSGSSLYATGTLTEYNVTSANTKPDDSDSGWTQTIPDVGNNQYLWARVTITFSNGNTTKFYNVSYGTSSTARKYYAHIRYSANADGNGMTSLPMQNDTAYIGIYLGTSQSAPISFTAYTWSALNLNQLTATQYNAYYAVTDTYSRPAESSASWSDQMPSIGQGQYLWSKNVVTYSDNSTSTQYSVVYSGTEGDNRSIAYLDNEKISFAADEDGKVAYTRRVIKVIGYNGLVKTAPVVGNAVDVLPDVSAIVSGVNDDNEVEIVIQVSQGATLNNLNSGEISIPVTMINNGYKTIDTSLKIYWTKISDHLYGTESVVMDVYTPNGNVMVNTNDELTLAVFAHKGGTNLVTTDSARYQWYKYTADGWSAVGGATNWTLTIGNNDVTGTTSYRCIMSYDSKSYSDVMTVMDKTDVYQANIISSAGEVLTSAGQTTQLTCLVYRNGKRVEEALTYQWRKMRKNGTIDPTFSATTASITVSTNDIDEKATYSCQVFNDLIAAITIVYSTDVIVDDHAPADPVEGMLWLDTSDNSNILYRWIDTYTKDDGTVVEAHWEKCTASVGDINALNRLIEQQADFFVNKDEIGGYVTTTQYDEDMRVVDQRIGNMALSDSDFALKFTSSGVRQTVQGDINSAINTYSQTVSKYLRYNGTTGVLSLGSEGDEHETFEAQLSQTKLAFIYRGEGSGSEGKEIAYVGINDMYITNARVTQALYIGYSDVGYFNWTVTETGIGLKWVGYDE